MRSHPALPVFAILGLNLLLPYVRAQSEEESWSSSTGQPPWGRLFRTPIYLEASQRLIDTLPLPSPQPRWSFPEEEAERLPSLLLQAGLSPALVDALTQPGRQLRAEGWIHLYPSYQEILSLDAKVRAALYSLLERHPINDYYQSPVLILSDTVEEWYRSAQIRPELVKLIAQLACRRGQVWAFSDLPLLLTQAQNEREARDLFKVFTRTRSYLVRIDITPETDPGQIKNFWTVGGRSWRLKDIEPLIQSIQETGEDVRLDIAHILPPLARKLLYSYPGQEHAAKGILPDCHWTSLNFFNYDPHDYLLDARLATSKVLDDYEPVEPPYLCGDILFFLDNREGNAFHSCVFLAEDLVFTKNGRNQLAPWIISTVEDVSRIYLSMNEGRVQGYRMRPLPPDA